MIIISQDEQVLLNFKNVAGIQVDGESIGLQLTNGDSLFIGDYKSNERAKEVLQELIKFYENKRVYECSVNKLSFTKNFVYEMPKE